MKRIVALTTVLTLLVTLAVLPGSATAAVSSATQAIIWEDFSRRKVGEKLDDSQMLCAEKEGSAVTVNTLGALGAVNAAKLSYESLRGYHNIFDNQGFKLFYNEPKSLKGVTHIIYYMRLPLSRADGEGNNWGKSGVAIMMYLGDYIWMTLKDKSKVEYLAKYSNCWRSVESQGMYADLPSGFEGYIKVPVSAYQSESLKGSVENHSLEHTIFQFSNMGAQCGSAYINAVYGVTQNTESIMVRLNNESAPRYYTTGATEADIKGETKLIESAMKARVLQNFASYPIGYELDKNGMVKYQHKDDVTARLSKNMGGIFSNPFIELYSPTVGGFHDSDPFYEIKYPAYTQIDDIKAVMFYIKCAAPHPAQPGKSTFRFNLMTQREGEESIWSLLGADGVCQYLEIGADRWKTPDSDDQGIVSLPENFEGYVMANIEEFKQGPIAHKLKDRFLISSTLQFQAVGGECGNGYIGGIYAVTDMTDKSHMLITFNDCDVYDLSTGGYASPNDITSDGPSNNIEYTEIPMANTSMKASVGNVTKNSCLVSWDAASGITSYRVDLYYPVQKENSTKIVYKCAQSKTCKATQLQIENLEPSKRYHTVVSGLSKLGTTMVVYKFTRFTTRPSKEPQKLEKGELLNDVSVVELERGSSFGENTVLIVMVGALAAVVLAGGTVGMVLWLRKRRITTKQKEEQHR